jgi:hypothetical protein
MVGEHGDGTFWCGRDRPENRDALADAGLDARDANNSVSARISAISRQLHPVPQSDGSRRPSLLICREAAEAIITYTPQLMRIADEFLAYSWQNGREQPQDGFDHALDALGYAAPGDGYGAYLQG